MSAGRSQRRRMQREKYARLARELDAGTPIRVRSVDKLHEIYLVGTIPVVVPKPAPADAPLEVREAIDDRRAATLHGRCRCGARRSVVRRHGQVRFEVAHAHDCSASDDGIVELVKASGWRFPT